MVSLEEIFTFIMLAGIGIGSLVSIIIVLHEIYIYIKNKVTKQ